MTTIEAAEAGFSKTAVETNNLDDDGYCMGCTWRPVNCQCALLAEEAAANASANAMYCSSCDWRLCKPEQETCGPCCSGSGECDPEDDCFCFCSVDNDTLDYLEDLAFLEKEKAAKTLREAANADKLAARIAVNAVKPFIVATNLKRTTANAAKAAWMLEKAKFPGRQTPECMIAKSAFLFEEASWLESRAAFYHAGATAKAKLEAVKASEEAAAEAEYVVAWWMMTGYERFSPPISRTHKME